MASKNSPKNGFMHLMERKRPFYICVIATQGICRAMAQAKNNKCPRAVFEYSGDTCKIKVMARDFFASNKYYLKLVKRKDKKLFRWLDEYQAKTRRAQELIRRYLKKKNPGYTDLDLVFSFFEDYFFVSTALPFFVLSGINLHLESGGKIGNFKKIVDMYNTLRIKDSIVDQATFRFVERAAAIIGCDPALASFLTPDEIRAVYKNGFFETRLLKKREKFCRVIINHSYKPVLEYGKKTVSKAGFAGRRKSIRVLNGSPAYGGIAQGTVRIINSVEDAVGFRRGGVIVSVNANPRIASYIKKASALVTDEGGIMCHATIFAREFKKPCITGTKVATKVFKNGDMVEVDANKGLVRKISV
ncbi:MAG: PEP-utilizing enzyme [bacterium]|nr:PEP-utilizing enzyme [bacterium]